jgi:hypothetical protein
VSTTTMTCTQTYINFLRFSCDAIKQLRLPIPTFFIPVGCQVPCRSIPTFFLFPCFTNPLNQTSPNLLMSHAKSSIISFYIDKPSAVEMF